MTEDKTTKRAPARKPRGTSKRISAIESRIDRLVARARIASSSTADHLDLLESWILDLVKVLCIHMDIGVSELFEAIGEEEEST